MRWWVWALPLWSALVAADGPPAPPPEVSAHVRDGHFNPGDFAWARGAFSGASPAETRAWTAIEGYVTSCRFAVPGNVRTEAAALGLHPVSPTYWAGYAGDVCGEAAMAGRTLGSVRSWADYRLALDAALPVYRIFDFAVKRAEDAAPIAGGDLRDRLIAIVVPDQMLREALSWGEGAAAGAPPIDATARSVLVALFWPPIRRIDHRNTAWLKAVIARTGWPTISQVGARAAGNAWLLVQHADDNPLFQYRMLRLMKPLVERGEVDRGNYALLYDRVMLPLTGRQRYGTQFICDGKGWHPQPLEDDANPDLVRGSAGLGDIATYRREMIAEYGERCPS